jgi:hypothetical protein
VFLELLFELCMAAVVADVILNVASAQIPDAPSKADLLVRRIQGRRNRGREDIGGLRTNVLH